MKKKNAPGRPKSNNEPTILINFRADSETLAVLDHIVERLRTQAGPGAIVNGGRSQAIRVAIHTMGATLPKK
jgi:hypothetical protein